MPNLIIRGFVERKNNKGGLLNTYIMILIEKIFRNFKNFSKILHNKTPCTMKRNFVVCGHPYIMRNAANNYVAKIKIKNSSPLCQCNKKLNYMCCVTNVYIYIIVPRSLCPSCQYYCNRRKIHHSLESRADTISKYNPNPHPLYRELINFLSLSRVQWYQPKQWQAIPEPLRQFLGKNEVISDKSKRKNIP